MVNRSPNDIFRIYDENKDYLYVHNKHLAKPRSYHFLVEIDPTTEPSAKTVSGFTAFRFSTKFKKDKFKKKKKIVYNDCLRMAEELTCGIKDYDLEESILMEKNTKTVFGETLQKNKDLANRLESTGIYLVNEKANPEVGETYAMVRKGKVAVKENPYHIAHVLFKDKSVNITLEANAGDPTLKYPQFGMYGNTASSTFDTFYKAYFEEEYPNSVTLVLVPRDIHDIANALTKPGKTETNYIPEKVNKRRLSPSRTAKNSEEVLHKRPRSSPSSQHNVTQKSASRSNSHSLEMADIPSSRTTGRSRARSRARSRSRYISMDEPPSKKNWLSGIFGQ
jgi:hypothetical protein